MSVPHGSHILMQWCGFSQKYIWIFQTIVNWTGSHLNHLLLGVDSGEDHVAGETNVNDGHTSYSLHRDWDQGSHLISWNVENLTEYVILQRWDCNSRPRTLLLQCTMSVLSCLTSRIYKLSCYRCIGYFIPVKLNTRYLFSVMIW